jgi:cyclic-di-AMP phosphodiesterase PgpH
MIINKERLKRIFRRWFHAIILISAIIIIYLFFPKQGMFKYEFHKGMTWRHTTLIAPFDFPLLKPNILIEQERDSLTQTFIPYFHIDTAAFVNTCEKIDSEIVRIINTEGINLTPDELENSQQTIYTILNELYSRGILENSIELYPALNGKDKLNIIRNNVSTTEEAHNLFTLKTAYIYLNENINNLIAKNTSLLKILPHLDLNKFIEHNLTYDPKINELRLKELHGELSMTRGFIPAGTRIISTDDIVTDDNFLLLESLKATYIKNNKYGGWISSAIGGQMILIAALLTTLFLYLQAFNRSLFLKKRNFLLIITNIVLTFLLARFIFENKTLSFYLLPICILPIIIRTFIGVRLSIFVLIITILIIGFMAPNSYEYAFIQIITGTMSVISLNKLHRRGHLIGTVIVVILSYLVLFIGFSLIKDGSLKIIQWGEFKWLIMSGVLVLISYPLIFIYERAFGFISDVTLMELSDTNHPLLRLLAEKAPGTFQHSMQVANLAEDVIRKTGGNPMLVRTGALYHDVGKIVNSQFFIENQLAGQNPHETLSHKKSAEIIINHVQEGVALARKNKIPEMIIDFIRMHHGKSIAKFFYIKHREENPDTVDLPAEFTYPGPNPLTREVAVLMLADSVEAATRSLEVKNHENLERIINQIIDSKVENHELDNAPITFRDIKDIKEIFLRKLLNIYHVRIQYPGMNIESGSL